MVEIYFNAQSDNGMLTSSELFFQSSPFSPGDIDLGVRSCPPSLVTELYAKHTACERPSGTVAAAELDDTSWIC